jgi:hypothetical protein
MSIGNLDAENALLAAISIAATDASARIQAATQSASIQANAQTSQMQIRVGGDETVANIESTSRTTTAQIQGQFAAQVAQIDAGWHAGVASTEAAAQTAVASTDAAARTSVASTAANAQISTANIESSWRNSIANIELTGTEYRADKEYEGVLFHENSETNRLNMTLAFAEDKWNALLPVITGVASEFTSGSGGQIGFGAHSPQGPTMHSGRTSGLDEFQVGTYWSKSAGLLQPPHMGGGDVKSGGIGFASGGSLADAVAATQLPFISPSGVLTPNEIQQQVNNEWATAAAKAASDQLQLVSDLTGRGFSANSPILQALNVSISGQALRGSLASELQLRLAAAKDNAEQSFSGQTALSDQYLKQEGVLVDSARNDVQRVVGVLQAVAGMIGSAL